MRRIKTPHPCVLPAVLDATWAADGYGIGGITAEEIAFVGDSITTYIDLGDATTGPWDIGYQTITRYRSGSKFDFLVNSATGLPYFASSGSRLYYVTNIRIPGFVTDALNAGAKVVFGHFGTNDAQNGGCTALTISGFEAAYRAEVAKVRAAGAVFVGSTLVGPSESSTATTLKADYARANALIRSLAAELNFPLADFAQVTGSGVEGETLDEYIAPAFGGDNLHPNPTGMHVMGAEAYRVLKPYLTTSRIDKFWEDIAAGVYGLELTSGYLFPAFTSNTPNGGYGSALGAGGTSLTLGSELADGGNWWTFDIVDAVKTGEHLFTSYPIPVAGHKGTAQAGAASTITLAAGASATNNIYSAANRNDWIWITSGTGAGQVRRITAYNGTTKVATVDAAWVTTPDSTSVYEVGTRTGERYIVACEVMLDPDFELRGIGLLHRSSSTPRNIGDAFSGGASISNYVADVTPPIGEPWTFRSPVRPVLSTADRWRCRLIIEGQGSGKLRKFGVWAVDRTANQLTFTP